jgi:FkbM family methyltransferase
VIRLESKKFVSLFTGAYSLLRPDRLLKIGAFRRAFIYAYFLYKKSFEDPFWNLVRRQPQVFRDGDILDIGANIGYTACVFAAVLKPGSKIYAFEPDQISFRLLEETVRRKNLSAAIEAIHQAVGSSDGSLKFWHNERHSADHRVVTEQFSSTRTDVARISTVPATTVDTFMKSRNLQNISFIKIDVQGYERAVCEGMKNTLGKFPQAVVCLEYSPDALRELGFEPSKVLDFFRTRGYHLYVLTREQPQLLADDNSLEALLKNQGYIDLLCSKLLLP